MNTRNIKSLQEGVKIEQDVTSSEIGEAYNHLIESLDEIQHAFKKQMQNQVSEFKPTENFPEYLRPKLDNQSIFYIVGELVAIKENVCQSLFPLAGKFQLRECILEDEIRKAFSSNGMIKLFLNEYDAVQYSRATRVGNIDNNEACWQSPVFTVECTDNLDLNLVKSGNILISEKNNKSEELVLFFEQDIKKIVPLKGQMIIQKNLFIKREYPAVSFENECEFSLVDLQSDHEKNERNQCRIM